MLGKFCIFLTFLACFVSMGAAQEKRGPQPTIISAPTPIYPKEAKEAGIGGRITVRVVVGESGDVLSVDDPTGPAQLCNGGNNDPRLVALRNAVVDAIKQAKFSPAMQDGKPVRSTIWVGSTFDPLADSTPSSEKKLIEADVVRGMAKRLPKPEYPGAARASRASGPVSVRVVVDENGDVFTAEAINGHPLLRSSAVAAACMAEFSQTKIEGKPVRVTGVITYNFFPGR